MQDRRRRTNQFIVDLKAMSKPQAEDVPGAAAEGGEREEEEPIELDEAALLEQIGELEVESPLITLLQNPMPSGTCTDVHDGSQQEQPDAMLHEIDVEEGAQERPAAPGKVPVGHSCRFQLSLSFERSSASSQLSSWSLYAGATLLVPASKIFDFNCKHADMQRLGQGAFHFRHWHTSVKTSSVISRIALQLAAEAQAEQEPGPVVPKEGTPEEGQGRDMVEGPLTDAKEGEAEQDQGHPEGQAAGAPGEVTGSVNTPLAAADAETGRSSSRKLETSKAQPPAIAGQAKPAALPVKKRTFTVQGDVHKPDASKGRAASAAEAKGPAVKSKVGALPRMCSMLLQFIIFACCLENAVNKIKRKGHLISSKLQKLLWHRLVLLYE
eukprot:14762-Pelagomonas_calceolata.AAC.1